MVYIIQHVPFDAEDIEHLGTKEKFWFFDADSQSSWLFKFSRPNTGEHWSEKAAEKLCEILSIPHAVYELADCNDRIGVVSKNLTRDGVRLVMGNEVLHRSSGNGEYPSPYGPTERYTKVPEHTVTRVLACLDQSPLLPPPSNYDLADLNAADVFCGYLMLDALISNQDRHHENWAIMVNDSERRIYLSPSYDHASSLGRELTDDFRLEKMQSRDRNNTVAGFVSRARSLLFHLKTDAKPLTTVDAFFHAVEKRVSARKFWLDKLRALDENVVRGVFEAFPLGVMTQTAMDFSVAMIIENKRRLLEDDRA